MKTFVVHTIEGDEIKVLMQKGALQLTSWHLPIIFEKGNMRMCGILQIPAELGKKYHTHLRGTWKKEITVHAYEKDNILQVVDIVKVVTEQGDITNAFMNGVYSPFSGYMLHPCSVEALNSGRPRGWRSGLVLMEDTIKEFNERTISL